MLDFEEAIRVFTEVYGPNHYETIKCINNVGVFYNTLKEKEKATNYLA